MNAEEIIALQKVSERYNREYMFKMLKEREEIINEALERIAQQEIENEDSLLEELVAQAY